MVLNRNMEDNLRDFLQKNHTNLTLKDRITMVYYLCYSLYDIIPYILFDNLSSIGPHNPKSVI